MANYAIALAGAPVVLPVDPDDVLWFGRMLEEKGVNLRARMNPALEAARDLALFVYVTQQVAAMAPASVRLEGCPPPNFDLPLATAVISLIRSFRRALSRDPDLFDSAWRVIAGGASVAIPQPQTSDRDHVWEVLNAAVYSQFATEVELNESGAGADVKGTFEGVRWGIECKVLYSTKVARRIDRIIDGVRQIEDDASVKKGVVIINTTDCIDHAPFHRSLSSDPVVFRSTEQVTAALAAAVKRVAVETSTRSLQQRVVSDKHGNRRVKCRAIIYLGQTVARAAGHVHVFTSQISVVRRPAEVTDKIFAERYHVGWRNL